MGIFDILTTPGKCPFCGYQQKWRVQFKYGDCRQNEKRIGDKISWSEKKLRFYDYGDNVGGLVQTGGSTENRCNSCKRVVIHATVSIRDNVIADVRLLKQAEDFGKSGFRKVR